MTGKNPFQSLFSRKKVIVTFCKGHSQKLSCVKIKSVEWVGWGNVSPTFLVFPGHYNSEQCPLCLRCMVAFLIFYFLSSLLSTSGVCCCWNLGAWIIVTRLIWPRVYYSCACGLIYWISLQWSYIYAFHPPGYNAKASNSVIPKTT